MSSGPDPCAPCPFHDSSRRVYSARSCGARCSSRPLPRAAPRPSRSCRDGSRARYHSSGSRCATTEHPKHRLVSGADSPGSPPAEASRRIPRSSSSRGFRNYRLASIAPPPRDADDHKQEQDESTKQRGSRHYSESCTQTYVWPFQTNQPLTCQSITRTPVRYPSNGARSQLENSRSEEHTSELQSLAYLVCRLLLEKKKTKALSYGNTAAR